MNSKFSTKTIVATGLGAAVFFLFFNFVKIPSPVPETNLQIAYGISCFFAAIFGPLAGFLIGFVGHALSDFISYGSPWWSWVVASGISALVVGFVSGKIAPAVEEGRFTFNEMKIFAIAAVIGNALAWLLVAPVLDIVIYAEPVSTVFLQGITAFILDAIVSCVIGIILLKAYASTKTGQGSLSRDN
ncbi:MAG: ECF-type riboflavin transporter substrate-binding protein [Solobacterium sp.]|nr:ECF-type riboflavin transporter substrate-binding protein [Solobacterium sp.]